MKRYRRFRVAFWSSNQRVSAGDGRVAATRAGICVSAVVVAWWPRSWFWWGAGRLARARRVHGGSAAGGGDQEKAVTNGTCVGGLLPTCRRLDTRATTTGIRRPAAGERPRHQAPTVI